MGLFSKKKAQEMDMPPLPPPEFQAEHIPSFEMPSPPPLPALPPVPEIRKRGDLPSITPKSEETFALSELPPLPAEEDFADVPEEEAVAPARFESQRTPSFQEEPEKIVIREKPRPAPEVPVTKHLFVSVQDYQRVYEHVSLMKEKIVETDEILVQLHEIKKQQEEQLAQWSKHLEAVQQKITYIDEMLFAEE